MHAVDNLNIASDFAARIRVLHLGATLIEA